MNGNRPGLPATQAGRGVYMLVIQLPEATAYIGWLSSRAEAKPDLTLLIFNKTT